MPFFQSKLICFQPHLKDNFETLQESELKIPGIVKLGSATTRCGDILGPRTLRPVVGSSASTTGVLRSLFIFITTLLFSVSYFSTNGSTVSTTSTARSVVLRASMICH